MMGSLKSFFDSMPQLKNFGESTFRGLIANNASKVASGILVETLRQYDVDIKKVEAFVNNKVSLWKHLEPRHQAMAKKAAAQAINLDWLTVNWLIETTRADHPALASLFLSWKKGRNWLEKQLEEIKTEVYR